MKVNLSLVAIILSIIAIVVSISQPIYSALTTTNRTESGTPSFSMTAPSDFYVFYTFTRMTIRNSGTATAHDVRVLVIFGNVTYGWEITELISQLNASDDVEINIPVGYMQLKSSIFTIDGQSWWNVTDYDAYVHITCRELSSTTSFHFQHFIT